jgi:hypothetical protein
MTQKSKTQKELTDKIRDMETHWNENRMKMTVEDSEKYSKEMADTRRALSDKIAEGAKPCPNCDSVTIIESRDENGKPVKTTVPVPILGMRRRVNTYEVGCPQCPPFAK